MPDHPKPPLAAPDASRLICTQVDQSLPSIRLPSVSKTLTTDKLGIRPEHISVAWGQEQNGSSFTAVVDVLEPLGADTLAVFSLAGTDVTARCRPGSIKAVGQRVPFSIEMSRVHVIEPETGLNVLG